MKRAMKMMTLLGPIGERRVLIRSVCAFSRLFNDNLLIYTFNFVFNQMNPIAFVRFLMRLWIQLLNRILCRRVLTKATNLTSVNLTVHLVIQLRNRRLQWIVPRQLLKMTRVNQPTVIFCEEIEKKLSFESHLT